MEQFSIDRFDGALEAPAWRALAPLIDAMHHTDAAAILTKKRTDLAHAESYLTALRTAPVIDATHCDFSQASVTIGRESDLTVDEKDALLQSLHAFLPWKKGPFRLFGTEIDAEWRSDLKWKRVRQQVGSLRDQVVCDIGCHNGYFMFRMAADRPKLVVGIEPVLKHMLAFHLLNGYARQDHLVFAPLGIEHMEMMPDAFDTIFCMGILYHHTDPVGLLRKLRASLKRGGRIVVDCQGIPGDEPVALTPQSRYASARGIWFLPTRTALEHWVTRAGFQEVSTFYSEPLSTEEQRRTVWAPVDSLAEFLSPVDPRKTREGYPAPWRHYLIAKR